MPLKRLVLLAALLWPLTTPQPAVAPTATVNFLHDWQAKRIVRSHAAMQQRPDFRVEGVRRIDGYRVKVCWSEPGYLGPDDGRDFGCDVVVLRNGRWWVHDDSVIGGVWIRWL